MRAPSCLMLFALGSAAAPAPGVRAFSEQGHQQSPPSQSPTALQLHGPCIVDGRLDCASASCRRQFSLLCTATAVPAHSAAPTTRPAVARAPLPSTRTPCALAAMPGHRRMAPGQQQLACTGAVLAAASSKAGHCVAHGGGVYTAAARVQNRSQKIATAEGD